MHMERDVYITTYMHVCSVHLFIETASKQRDLIDVEMVSSQKT